MLKEKHDLIIIGGGLAGLIAAIQAKRAGIAVLLLEKKQYPFHRVCGEYISNEVKPFLQREGLYPESFQPSNLEHFKLSDIKGNSCDIALPLGGFGISRYQLDNFLYEKALLEGVNVQTATEVSDVVFADDSFKLILKNGNELNSSFVIGAYGKRAKLDGKLDRSFMKKRSPFIGVKYHAYIDYPKNEIGLYNFRGGYCGVSHVESGLVNICYLSKRSKLKEYGDIKTMEQEVLFENPHLKRILKTAVFLRDKPEVINEISFERKAAVENHILMAGDTAGLITPLCGNGMAMAIHAGKIAADTLKEFYGGKLASRIEVENAYKKQWTHHFSQRLWVGRKTQNLFGNQFRSNLSVSLLKNYPKLGKKIIQQTHGEIF